MGRGQGRRLAMTTLPAVGDARHLLDSQCLDYFTRFYEQKTMAAARTATHYPWRQHVSISTDTPGSMVKVPGSKGWLCPLDKFHIHVEPFQPKSHFFDNRFAVLDLTISHEVNHKIFEYGG